MVSALSIFGTEVTEVILDSVIVLFLGVSVNIMSKAKFNRDYVCY